MIFSPSKLSWPMRYGIGIALAGSVLAAQSALSLLVQGRIPFLFFLPSVALSALLLGRGPSALVFLAGLLHGAMVLPPSTSLEVAAIGDRIALFAYFCVGLFFMVLGNWGRNASWRAVLAEERLLAERLQAQQAAQENDVRFRVALDTSAVPFSILEPVRDEAGKIVDFRWAYMNHAAGTILGRPAHELVGRQVNEVLPGSWDEPGLLDRYATVSENGTPQIFEMNSSANGIEGWFHVVASPLQGSVVVWFADVTTRKGQEQALQEADRRKDQFLATLAHELRNPLAPIRQAAALSRLSNLPEEKRRWSSDVIERQVRNMALLLDDLLDVSRITRGQLTLRKSRIELRTVLESALETARPLLDARQHELEFIAPAQPVYLEADELRLAQVVANLLTNAAKYTEPGGQIELKAELRRGEVTITVADNGIGIEPAMLDEVFTMFTQVSRGTNSPYGGLGIGLALARGLVELHGGRIEAASAGLGRGSRFTVHLPVTAVAGKIPASSPEAQASAATHRVLVADDNRDAADTLATLLELDGHEVKVAYDGEQAVAAFADFAPDVALLDIGMPRLSGIEVARRIRHAPGGEATTLVAITGWGQNSDRAKTREAGFDLHLTKPVDGERLRTLLADTPPATASRPS